MMELPLVVQGAQPFYLPAGRTGCLVLHGFSANPEEMRWLGDYLYSQGHTILGVRLAGHGTDPHDLARTRWADWLIDVEDGLGILRATTERVLVIGQSMGGMIALTAAARYAVDAVVAISTPYQIFDQELLANLPAIRRRKTLERKPAAAHATLGLRREADYPAYAAVPVCIYAEIAGLQEALQAALPQVAAPALLIHSQSDAAVPAAALQQIYDRLSSTCKEMILLEGFDHSVVRDPKRQVVFERIGEFIRTLGQVD